MFGLLVSCLSIIISKRKLFIYFLGKTVFPDYFYPPAKQWWINQILNYHKQLKFDGLWIDMK